MAGQKCTNKTREKDRWDEYEFRQCGYCEFLYTYKGQHWLDDEVRCDAPHGVEYGDTIMPRKIMKRKKKENEKE